MPLPRLISRPATPHKTNRAINDSLHLRHFFFGIVQRIGDIHDVPGRLLVLNLNQIVHLTYFFQYYIDQESRRIKNS